MDFDSIRNQVANLTLYDLKAGVRKVQNAVMNYTEMETKVREATNNDPWGAPSSLMQDIANGTHNYQQLNEIMPLIYKRFTDKGVEEWRQIYKSLQLLEYLIKNGSERVIDDARSHLSLLRMLRQFHYIDPNGKDQGVNVRNRAQELAKLLSDVDAIRQERKKARANRNKYSGVEGGAGLGSSGMSGGSRYGGFGSDEAGYGGYSGEVYGDGGGFGGRETNFSDTQRRGETFEEYDEGVEENTAPARSSRATGASGGKARRESLKSKPKEPEEDLFDFGDEPATNTASLDGRAPASSNDILADLAPQQIDIAGDDDFDDFQSATSPSIPALNNSVVSALSRPLGASTQFAAPKQAAPAQTADLRTLFTATSQQPTPSSSTITPATSTISSPPPQAQKPAQLPAQYKPSGPNYFTSVPLSTNLQAPTSPPVSSAFSNISQPTAAASIMANLGKPTPKPTTSTGAGGDAFGNLWSTASSKAGIQSRSTTPKGQDLASMAKAKSEAGIWGSASTSSTGSAMNPAGRSGTQTPTSISAATSSGKTSQPLGNGLDDLLG